MTFGTAWRGSPYILVLPLQWAHSVFPFPFPSDSPRWLISFPHRHPPLFHSYAVLAALIQPSCNRWVVILLVTALLLVEDRRRDLPVTAEYGRECLGLAYATVSDVHT